MKNKSVQFLKEIWNQCPSMFKWSLVFFVIMTLVGMMASLLVGCTVIENVWKKYPQDNVIEEAVEDVIKKETGLDIDLTPFSPEQKPVVKIPLKNF